jgi:hypothetical protein
MRLVMIFSFADRLQSKMVEVGFRELLQLFLKLSKEGMGRTFDPDTLLTSGESAIYVLRGLHASRDHKLIHQVYRRLPTSSRPCLLFCH